MSWEIAQVGLDALIIIGSKSEEEEDGDDSEDHSGFAASEISLTNLGMSAVTILARLLCIDQEWGTKLIADKSEACLRKYQELLSNLQSPPALIAEVERQLALLTSIVNFTICVLSTVEDMVDKWPPEPSSRNSQHLQGQELPIDNPVADLKNYAEARLVALPLRIME